MATDTSAFLHVTCGCGHHFSWTGTVFDRPPCPECGHELDLPVIKEAAEKVARLRAELIAEWDAEDREPQP